MKAFSLARRDFIGSEDHVDDDLWKRVRGKHVEGLGLSVH